MPDLDLQPDLARGPSPSPDPTVLPDSPARALAVFEAGLDRAYGPDAAYVRDSLRVESDTFGRERALNWLANGGFGAVEDPAMNAAVVGALRAGADAGTIVREGPTPSIGDDIVVLHDREGANPLPWNNTWAAPGHTAVMIGNDQTGWRLYSKDGKSDGDTMRTNDAGERQTDGPMYASFPTLDAFFENDRFSGRYEDAVRVEFNNGDPAGRGALAAHAAEAILREDYHLFRSSCATTVQAALDAAGIPGFSMTQTRVVGSGQYGPVTTYEDRTSPIIPDVQFSRLDRMEGADDVRSQAQIDWERRSADDGR